MTQATFKQDTHAFEYCNINKVMLSTREYDLKTFESLYDKHSPKNFGYILMHADTKPEAEELLMNVYLKIWDDIKAFVDNINVEKKIIALVLSEVKSYNQKKYCSSPGESKLFHWAYNTFMIGAVIYLFFLK